MPLSADTLLRLMNRVPSPPPDSPAHVMREAVFRRKFIGPEDGPLSDDSPKDTVTEMVYGKGITQLVAWDQDGKVGVTMVLATAAIRDSDADYLLQRCREMYRADHPERALHIL